MLMHEKTCDAYTKTDALATATLKIELTKDVNHLRPPDKNA